MNDAGDVVTGGWFCDSTKPAGIAVAEHCVLAVNCSLAPSRVVFPPPGRPSINNPKGTHGFRLFELCSK